MKLRIALASAALIAAISAGTPAAFAHGDDEKGKPQHGGQYLMDEFHHGVEMVAAGDSLTFHITEHLEPLDVTGTSFKAVVQTDAGTKILSLVGEGSMLKTPLEAPLPAGARIVLTGKDSHGDAIQARFVKE